MFIDEAKLKKDMGKLILRQRKSLGFSQEYLAQITGITVRTLSSIENGRSFISMDALCQVCKFFKIPPRAFFDFDSADVNEQKLNTILEKLRAGGDEKIDFYYNIINLIDTKYHE